MRILKFANAAAGVAICAGMLGAVPVYAQEGVEVGEILVTARARGESVQAVPLAITAFSGDDLEKRAVVNMSDISRITPGFAFEDYGTGSTSPVIRGTTQVAGSIEQPVSFFLDGVYLPRGFITNIGFWGVERLEVVKGPQSARYGRNAFSGAVNYVTRKPEDQLGIEASVTGGVYGRFDAAALVTTPVIPDVLSVIAGYSHTEFDGSWRNRHPHCDIDFSLGTDCRVGGYDNQTINAGLSFTPTDRLTVDFTFFDFKKKLEQAATVYFGELDSKSELLNCGQWNPDVRPAGAGGLGFGGEWYRLYCGELPVDPMPIDPRGYGAQTDANFLRASLRYELTDNLAFSYVYGRVLAKNRVNYYNDQLPDCTYLDYGTCNLSTIGTDRIVSHSHDARLSFDNGGAFTASVGYLYAPSDARSTNAYGSMAYLDAPPTEPMNVTDPSGYATYALLGSNDTSNSIHSPFAEIQLRLMDGRLRFGAEGRYTEEERFQQRITSATDAGELVMVPTGPEYHATYKYFTPRFTVDFDIAPRHLIYGSVAKGVKSGGFNTTAFLPENRVFAEDSNWTYELGSKNTFGPLRLNVSAFLIKWADMQIPAADPMNPAVLPQSITMNLGNMTSKGIEVETDYRFGRNFSLGGTVYLGDSSFDEGTYHLNFARRPLACDDVVCPTDGYIGGNATPRAPNFMGTLSADWDDTLTDDIDYNIHLDLSHQSKAYADEVNLAYVSERTIVNGTIGLTVRNDYEIRLWVRNLLDTKYLSNASMQSPNVSYRGALGDRRTTGITLSAKY